MESNAMTLSTVGSDGRVTSRVVLLKGIEDRGLVFYTNYDSQKGQQMADNPNVALNFYWGQLSRQVRVEGTVEKVSREKSAEYFQVRPRKSQIGAAVSSQSRGIDSRESLEKLFAEFESEHEGQDIPLPDNWGGYLVVPTYLEFWQGRRSRLHDRVIYQKDSDGVWLIKRLQP